MTLWLPHFYLQLSSIVSGGGLTPGARVPAKTPDFLKPLGERIPLSRLRFGFHSSVWQCVCVCVFLSIFVTLRLEDKMYSGTIISANLRSPNLEVMTLDRKKSS